MKSILSEEMIEKLPGWYSKEAREALLNPEENIILATIMIGRLFRSGDYGRTDYDLKEWIRNTSLDDFDIIVGTAQSMLDDQLEIVYKLFRSNEDIARIISQSFNRNTFSEAFLEEAWSGKNKEFYENEDNKCVDLIISRDDTESILVFLGVARTVMKHERVTEYERMILSKVRELDSIAGVIAEIIIRKALDKIVKNENYTWLDRMSILDSDCWWN